MGRLFDTILKIAKSEFDEYEYYLPKKSTLEKVNNREGLSRDEIKDYVNYIINNYYLSSDDSCKLANFSAEWIKFHADNQLIQKRKNRAYKDIISDLNKGRPINVLDALWLSDIIFIDDINSSRKRIVKKVNLGEELDLDVITGRADINVEYHVSALGSLLSSKTLSKPVANKF